MEDTEAKKQDELQKLAVLKAVAVKQAMSEVIAENRDDIVKRARAKLTAMGVSVQDADDL